MKIKKKIVIMDIIIVLLVLVNACMIIAIKENSDNIEKCIFILLSIEIL